METVTHVSLWLRWVVLVAVLSMSCATAAGTCMDSETCCIEAHPGNPAACGLTTAEATAILAAGAAATTAAVITETDLSDPKEWDDSHNASLPEWKRRCIRLYGDCQDGRLDGPCYACFRRCEGQHEWPVDMCGPKRRKR